MFIAFVTVLLFAFIFELLIQRRWIGVMHKMKIEQVTKLYGPSWHEKTKMGTPTMGGIVFIPVALLCLPLIMTLSGDFSWEYALRLLSYPIAAAAVGLIDDWMKYSRHSSDGLKSLQKLALQTAVTIPWALWVSSPPYMILPGIELSRALFVLLVAFIGVGLQNAVNVTDGLDGLAAGCSLISFTAALTFIDGGAALTLFIAAACGICLGFLWHNANPAEVFMGDVGAHFLAGFLLSICLNAGVLIFVVPLGFFFGVEILSVAIQIIAIRCFHRKVFRMSPIHHHFEMAGWQETRIVTRFWIAHILGIVLLMAAVLYLAVRGL
ncbi:MAG: phospho-N-acetylmuramoyl-pentapeptide-transferase [Synergistaceae bacterium]|nr:phospho-N-acetylmuramoyl-pentapeptide-transferase [Synergistaceae bacterium]